MKAIGVIVIVVIVAAGIMLTHETGAFVDDVRGDDEYANRE